ncbi:putative poly(beta-D-mannuronate) O-acetylase [Enhygromyxa salina]|uniref:Putative poly(Beta-D-mannuronate) O-acetylase n=1 Tax=Enhygromyxa salina TaxID=215803 RepID=A0A0C2CY98_9BACT|nr:MBOAT family O-acyltransferase [Enhygromyxa salina]KIG12802.1 putative poly(beta-D-mannuronate) O-acetylase [Enhygromyxa salina]
MLFPTFDFLLFVIPALLGFWLLAERPIARTVWLLVASYFFYMAGPKTEPPPAPAYFAGLLLFSTVLDFVCGKRIHELAPDVDSEDPARAARAKRRRKGWLMASLVGNLGLLGYFKYVNFFLQAFADMAGVVDIDITPLHLDVILPLGISFYTFQSLSYTLDIHGGRLEPEPSFSRFALFVVFFPQLVAGPIVRATDLLPQLRAGPRFSVAHIEEGAFRICKGLAKKVVLGDWIAVHLTDAIFDAPGAYTSAELMLALYAYTLQIYADFSGYTDIAIGTGRLLGFQLPENFDRPYQSLDIAEYWRRWHMTLSGWLRNYVFFPVIMRLGARGGYVAVWLTMFLVGMWHGASWNFVIYANLHAAAVVFNRWNRTRDRDQPRWRKLLGLQFSMVIFAAIMAALMHYVLALPWEQAGWVGGVMGIVFGLICTLPLPNEGGKLMAVVHVVLTFHLLVFSRIFFRAQGLGNARTIVAGLADFDLAHGIRPGLVSPWVAVALIGGLAVHFTPKKWVDEHLMGVFRKTPGWVLGVVFVAFTYGLMKLMSGSPRAFIYFQF